MSTESAWRSEGFTFAEGAPQIAAHHPSVMLVAAGRDLGQPAPLGLLRSQRRSAACGGRVTSLGNCDKCRS
jgi:hypothetical protein